MKHIIISSLYLISLFCLSRFVFTPVYLYDEIKWLDIPMHVMGGFGIAFFVSSILFYKKKEVTYKKIFIIYAIVAISWELYEYFFNVMFLKEWSSWIDTISDFINGLVGMSIAYLFIRK